MKKNVLILAALFASVLCLVGCNPMHDVKVEDVAVDLAPSAFEKSSRSKTTVDGLNMYVVEYTITNAETNEITRFGYTFGDGVAKEDAPVVMTYVQLGLAENGLGMNYKFITKEEEIAVLFWGNSLVLPNETMSDASAPIANLKKIEETFPNREWLLANDNYYIDTTIHHIDRRDTVKHVEVIDGKKQWVIDSVKVTVKDSAAYDTIGVKHLSHVNYKFMRNEAFVNTGSKHETYEWYDRVQREGLKDTIAFVRDSSAHVDFHWGLTSMVSATRFVLNIKANDVDSIETLSIAKMAFVNNKENGELKSGTVEIKSVPYVLVLGE